MQNNTNNTDAGISAGETVALCELAGLASAAAVAGLFRKAVVSKPRDAALRRIEISAWRVNGRTVFQAERFLCDGKATHENLTPDVPEDRLCEIFAEGAQVNVLTGVGDCEFRRSRGGRDVLIGADKLRRALDSRGDAGCGCVTDEQIGGHDRIKNYILTGGEDFLIQLGISDKSGRVHDKKRAKFRQINRFLEYIRDILPSLPREGGLRIYDLCCGKSYLSFAVYYYFTEILGRDVEMRGVDLKPDVIEYCSTLAKSLNFNGLSFRCGDIGSLAEPAVPGGTPESREDFKPHMVVSLHACDTATDAVLRLAAELGADVILSTPCCHNELYGRINCGELDFIAKYPLLRRKLCEAATDALRLTFLEGRGYAVEALELVDPEDTPKNLLIRAVKRGGNSRRTAQSTAGYESCLRYLTGGMTE